jgi:two-component system cell cycle sensor histidine kinase/response regulator CckA
MRTQTPSSWLSYGAGVLLMGFGAFVAFLPERVHDPIEREAGLLLIIAALAATFAVRSTTTAHDELRTRLESQQRTEQELVWSEERLTLAQKVARIGTWDMPDFATQESTWSESLRELYGVGPDARASYHNFIALVHPQDQPFVRDEIEAAFARGGDFEFEYRVVRDGSVGWLQSKGRVIMDDAGKPTRALGVAIDITDRKLGEDERAQLERQLRQAQKLESLGQLAGGVAHDFNNLLLLIRGYGELALAGVERSEDPRADIEEMLAGADRAAALTRQLLAFSRRQVLTPEVLDLNDVAGDLDKLLGRLIGEDLELLTRVGSDPVCVSADRGQLEQVIINLSVNARDSMPEGGKLTIEVGTAEIEDDQSGLGVPPGRFAVLAVSDTGSGMDAETTAQIFEPFFTTKADGTGLGLATVHGIVEQSGGSIWVYSELGHGTTFKVYLPLVAEKTSTQALSPAGAASVPARGTGQTILLVEDDAQVRRIVSMMLESRGYRVLETSSGEEALAEGDANDGAVDLLITDLIMPRMSGREVAEQVRRLSPETQVLYMSGYTDDAVVRSGALDEKTAFLQKPFTTVELTQKVAELLRSKPVAV